MIAVGFLGIASVLFKEKQMGVIRVHAIMPFPMTSGQYVIQKIFIGFLFGCLSAGIATAFCFRLSPAGMAAMLALIVLSAFVSSLIGLFIGRISEGMMVGVVYIKIVMIVFMAVPLLKYLATAGNKVASYLCYLIPSSATFEGIMDLANGGMATAGKDTVILAVHCVFWCLLYSREQRAKCACSHAHLATAARVNTPLLCSAASLMPRCLQRGC